MKILCLLFQGFMVEFDRTMQGLHALRVVTMSMEQATSVLTAAYVVLVYFMILTLLYVNLNKSSILMLILALCL